ncbi:MAG: hypothetical protein R2862_00385 [Thermoanaerobaculia bacterium]
MEGKKKAGALARPARYDSRRSRLRLEEELQADANRTRLLERVSERHAGIRLEVERILGSGEHRRIQTTTEEVVVAAVAGVCIAEVAFVLVVVDEQRRILVEQVEDVDAGLEREVTDLERMGDQEVGLGQRVRRTRVAAAEREERNSDVVPLGGDRRAEP